MANFISKKLKDSPVTREKIFVNIYILISVLIKNINRCAMFCSNHIACVFSFFIFKTPYIIRTILYSFIEEKTQIF